jgi:hypothetical protein
MPKTLSQMDCPRLKQLLLLRDSCSLPKSVATLSIFAGYFVFLLILALPHGLATSFSWELWWNKRLYNFYPTNTAEDIVSLFCYPSGDQIWFAKAAILLATNSFTASDYWILAIFAPGLSIIEFVLLKLFGLKCPIVLCLSLITCGAWALVLFNLHQLAKDRMGTVLSYLAPTLISLSVIWRQYCLQGGILLTETLAIAFVAASFLLLLRATINRCSSFAIYSGVLLAMAAYLRTQAELIGASLSLITTLAIVGQLVIHGLKENQKQSADPISTDRWIKMKLLINRHVVLKFFVIAILAFSCCTAPYRLWNFYKFHNLSWLQVDFYWKMGWETESELAKTNDSWIVKGGMLAPSHVNPELAAKIQTNLKVHGENAYSDSFYKWRTITTFLRHPLQWISYKAKFLPWFWFAPINSHTPAGIATQTEYIENWLYVTIIIFCLTRFVIIAGIQKNSEEQESVYTLFYSGIILSTAITFVFVHFEPRYFYIIKIMSTIMFLSYFLSRQSRLTRTIFG